jgi:hypothetical protein
MTALIANPPATPSVMFATIAHDADARSTLGLGRTLRHVRPGIRCRKHRQSDVRVRRPLVLDAGMFG